MFSEKLQAIDIDFSHVANLAGLFKRALAKAGQRESLDARPGLWVMLDQGMVESAYHTGRGNVSSEIKNVDLQDLAALAKKFGAARVFILRKDALLKLALSMRTGHALDRDLLEQGFVIFGPDAVAGPAIHPLTGLNDINYSGLFNIAKLAAPSGELIVFAVFDPAGKDLSGLPVFTSLILGFDRERQLELITTTSSLAAKGLGPLADWKNDYRKIVRLAAEKFGPVAMGIFSTREFLAEMEQTPKPDLLKAFRDLLKQKKIIIEPFPLKFKMLLKAGGMFK